MNSKRCPGLGQYPWTKLTYRAISWALLSSVANVLIGEQGTESPAYSLSADANVTKILYLKQVARSTLTRTKFRRIFSGSEVVVAGRQSSEDFTSEVKGQSLSGNSQYSFTPTALPPADTNANASSMERLWAHLTIQQLLEKQDAGTDDVNDYYCCDEADDDGDRNNTDALTLALRVSARLSHIGSVTSDAFVTKCALFPMPQVDEKTFRQKLSTYKCSCV